MTAMLVTCVSLACGGALLGGAAVALAVGRHRPRYHGRHRAEF